MLSSSCAELLARFAEVAHADGCADGDAEEAAAEAALALFDWGLRVGVVQDTRGNLDAADVAAQRALNAKETKTSILEMRGAATAAQGTGLRHALTSERERSQIKI